MIYKGTIDFLCNIPIEFNFLEWIVGIITTFLLIYFFRAKIKLDKIAIDNDKIKIQVVNNSPFFMATNILVEAALVKNDQTFHFKLDRSQFILLPKKCKKCNSEQNKRSFCTIDFEESTINLMGGINTYMQTISNLPENIIIRIRIHANHEFTNFGKAFEFKYRYNQGQFNRI